MVSLKSIRFLQTLVLVFTLSSCAASSSTATTRNTIALLVPSTGHWHMQKHDENHDYFQAMDEGCKRNGIQLEVFKDWHQPAILKDYVHFRLDAACSSGVIKDQLMLDRVRKARILLHAAVPDQVRSGIEAGWRADHRILAAQALAFKVIEYQKAGNNVQLIGLGVGGGQIVAGTSRLLANDYAEKTKSIAGVFGELANALDGTAPFFGPYAVFIKWGASAAAFASRAAEILKNDKFLWQTAQLPVAMYREYCFAKTTQPQYLINKLFTIAVPVGQEHFAPNIENVEFYYNLYAPADIKCKFMGQKLGIDPTKKSQIVNLAIHFERGLLPAGHLRMVNSKTMASWIPSIHEQIQNPKEFKFGVPGLLTIFKDVAPFYREKVS